MPQVRWISSPSLEHRIEADIDGTIVASIDSVLFGDDVMYKIKSYLPRLNGAITARLEQAQSWVESEVSDVDSDPSKWPARPGYIRIADLDRVKHLVKIKKLAELAGLNASSIAQKVGRGTELSVTESEAMAKVLIENGVIIERRV